MLSIPAPTIVATFDLTCAYSASKTHSIPKDFMVTSTQQQEREAVATIEPGRRTVLRFLIAAQALSQTGSEASLVAAPLFAIAVLSVTPAQMGVLEAAERVPLVLSLFSGMLIDRFSSGPFLIAADLLRGAILVAVVLAAFGHHLSFGWYLAAIVAVSAAKLFFDVGMSVFVPVLVGNDGLDEANIAMGRAQSVTELAGPALGGMFAQFFGAAWVMLADGVSFLVSGLCMVPIGAAAARARNASAPRAPGGLFAGWHAIRATPGLLPLICGSAIWNFFYAGIAAMLVLFYVRDLHLNALTIGTSFVPTGVGFLAGSLVVGRVNARLGRRGAMLAGAWMTVGWIALVLAVRAPYALVLAAIDGAAFLFGFGQALYNINARTIRQLLSPEAVRGSIAATAQVLILGLFPLGGLFGGFLAMGIGLRATLVALGAGLALSVVLMHRLRTSEATAA